MTKASVLLTIRKCQYTDDKEEGDDQDEPHPEITVRISIISAGRMHKKQLIPPVITIKCYYKAPR